VPINTGLPMADGSVLGLALDPMSPTTHVSPPSRLFKNPPPSVAPYTVVGVVGSTAMALTVPSFGPWVVHTPLLAMLAQRRAPPQHAPASTRPGRGDPLSCIRAASRVPWSPPPARDALPLG
jgi:hypothetical protein